VQYRMLMKSVVAASLQNIDGSVDAYVSSMMGVMHSMNSIFTVYFHHQCWRLLAAIDAALVSN
jgi:hypothetical protein